jgi:hypothetical protein
VGVAGQAVELGDEQHAAPGATLGQAKQAEAEEQRAKAWQEREEAEFLARQAELRAQQAEAGKRHVHEAANRVADAALVPVEVATKAARQTTRLMTEAAETDGNADRRSSA